MASSFDHADVRFLLAASAQLYVSQALILPGRARRAVVDVAKLIKIDRGEANEEPVAPLAE